MSDNDSSTRQNLIASMNNFRITEEQREQSGADIAPGGHRPGNNPTSSHVYTADPGSSHLYQFPPQLHTALPPPPQLASVPAYPTHSPTAPKSGAPIQPTVISAVTAASPSKPFAGVEPTKTNYIHHPKSVANASARPTSPSHNAANQPKSNFCYPVSTVSPAKNRGPSVGRTPKSPSAEPTYMMPPTTPPPTYRPQLTPPPPLTPTAPIASKVIVHPTEMPAQHTIVSIQEPAIPQPAVSPAKSKFPSVGRTQKPANPSAEQTYMMPPPPTYRPQLTPPVLPTQTPTAPIASKVSSYHPTEIPAQPTLVVDPSGSSIQEPSNPQSVVSSSLPSAMKCPDSAVNSKATTYSCQSTIPPSTYGPTTRCEESTDNSSVMSRTQYSSSVAPSLAMTQTYNSSQYSTAGNSAMPSSTLSYNSLQYTSAAGNSVSRTQYSSSVAPSAMTQTCTSSQYSTSGGTSMTQEPSSSKYQ